MPQSTLTVWKFDTPDGARNAVKAVEDLQRENLLVVLDYATVSWERGKKRPTTKQGTPATSTAAVGGAFWGMLFGLIFFVPLLGAAVGAAAGAFAGSMADIGIDDHFINKVRDKVTPGTRRSSSSRPTPSSTGSRASSPPRRRPSSSTPTCPRSRRPRCGWCSRKVDLGSRPARRGPLATCPQHP